MLNSLTIISRKKKERRKFTEEFKKQVVSLFNAGKPRCEIIREYDLNDDNDTIYELEDKVSKLEETLYYFKELWNKFIKFLQNKFFSSNEYDDFINDLYDEEIIDDNELDITQNNSKNKDDFNKDL